MYIRDRFVEIRSECIFQYVFSITFGLRWLFCTMVIPIFDLTYSRRVGNKTFDQSKPPKWPKMTSSANFHKLTFFFRKLTSQTKKKKLWKSELVGRPLGLMHELTPAVTSAQVIELGVHNWSSHPQRLYVDSHYLRFEISTTNLFGILIHRNSWWFSKKKRRRAGGRWCWPQTTPRMCASNGAWVPKMKIWSAGSSLLRLVVLEHVFVTLTNINWDILGEWYRKWPISKCFFFDILKPADPFRICHFLGLRIFFIGTKTL